MYFEVIHDGNVFVFFQVGGVFYLRPGGRLVVLTPAERHEFDGMTDELWREVEGYLGPHQKLGIDLDKKRMYLVGLGD